MQKGTVPNVKRKIPTPSPTTTLHFRKNSEKKLSQAIIVRARATEKNSPTTKEKRENSLHVRLFSALYDSLFVARKTITESQSATWGTCLLALSLEPAIFRRSMPCASVCALSSRALKRKFSHVTCRCNTKSRYSHCCHATLLTAVLGKRGIPPGN